MEVAGSEPTGKRCAGRFFLRPWVWQSLLCFALPLAVSLAAHRTRHQDFVRAADIAVTAGASDLYAVQLDPVEVQKRYFVITGKVAQRGKDTFWTKPRVIVAAAGHDHGLSFAANAVETETAWPGDGKKHGHSGFRAIVPKKAVASAGPLSILLSLEEQGRRVVIDTHRSLPAVP